MKKLILPVLLILAIGAYTSCYAQKVPDSVKMAFTKKFPQAKNVKWGMENAHEYEAEFVNNGQKLSANFKTNGTWVETEQDISVSDLPANITKNLKANYPDVELKGASHIWNPIGEQYEIAAEVKEKNVEFVYSADGKLLSHTQLKENDEADGD